MCYWTSVTIQTKLRKRTKKTNLIKMYLITHAYITMNIMYVLFKQQVSLRYIRRLV